MHGGKVTPHPLGSPPRAEINFPRLINNKFQTPWANERYVAQKYCLACWGASLCYQGVRRHTANNHPYIYYYCTFPSCLFIRNSLLGYRPPPPPPPPRSGTPFGAFSSAGNSVCQTPGSVADPHIYRTKPSFDFGAVRLWCATVLSESRALSPVPLNLTPKMDS